MRLAPLPGPYGLYTVSVLPRFLLGSDRVGWQGAYFTDIDCALQGSVDHGHTRYCVQRTMQPERRRAHGTRDWYGVAAGFSVCRAGDQQHHDWCSGGRSQFLFVDADVVESLWGRDRPLPSVGQREPLRSHLLETLFDALQSDLAQGSPAGPLVGESLIMAVLGHLGAAQPLKLLASASRGCAAAIDLIEAHFANPISLQDLADAAGIGQRQLCRAFHEVTGLSPHQYLLRRRVEHAQRLIGQGMALGDVALECGFTDQSQLTRTFVRQVGTTPGRYRSHLGR